MQAAWQNLHVNLVRAIDTVKAKRWLDAARQRSRDLRPFDDTVSLIDHLHGQGGDLDAKDRIIAALVREVQAGAEDSGSAASMLWVAMWPALDALYRRLWRHFKNAPDELVSEIAGRFSAVMHRADLTRIRRVACTLVRNTERDIRCALRRQWAERSCQVPLIEDHETVNGDLTDFPMTAGVSPLGLPPCLDADGQTEAIRHRLLRVADRDVEVIVAIVIAGERQTEMACRLGIAPDAARKRFQRALARVREQVA